ncbi:MAG: DUF4111 domain-containing protein [Clostridiales bacterium]|nr:DUF4111 domain-containing protein [Clostridiales bacterium]
MLCDFLTHFARMSQGLFRDNLIGVYLHGSLTMGCFNPEKSDIDLLLVVETEPTDTEKLAFMQEVAFLSEEAPAKGLELSVVTRDAVKPFQYPTPYVLHFSPMHADWFQRDPVGYVELMKGEDPDLAAHCTILRQYGVVLYGTSIASTFDPVPKAAYLDSIWQDVQGAQEDILLDPLYITLNLCRVAAFVQEGLVLSKREGGRWGLNHLPERYHGLIRQALACYATNEALTVDPCLTTDFAA